MTEAWIGRSRQALMHLADPEGGWGYREGGPAATEATALASLGLLAESRDADDPARALVARSADAMVRLQRPDGSLGVTAAFAGPGWATPFAMLLWQALGSHRESRRRAAAWLLAERVDTPPRSADPDHVAGHDTSIPGWPWVEGTHSWIEPTALAILALRREGRRGHARVVDGLRVVGDRAIARGGWNYGNNVVFGRPLRPQPGPTGLALLALARSGSAPKVDDALAYLQATLPTVRAASSLAWGLLGLLAWGIRPAASGDWLAESALGVIDRGGAAPRLGLLLLAAGADPLPLLGLEPTEGRPR